MKLIVRIMMIGLMSSALIVARELSGTTFVVVNNDEAIMDNWEGVDPAGVPGYIPLVLTPEQQLAQRLQRELAAMEDGVEKERMLTQLNLIPSGQLLQSLLARQSNGRTSPSGGRAGAMHGVAASGNYHGHNSLAPTAGSGSRRSEIRPRPGTYSFTGALWSFCSDLKEFVSSLQEGKDK